MEFHLFGMVRNRKLQVAYTSIFLCWCVNSYCFIFHLVLSSKFSWLVENEQGIFDQVLHGDLDFSSDPWPSISESAKDLVRKMLVRDPKKRLTAHEVLCECSCFY